MLPAYAGMIPMLTDALITIAGAPRVCGDDPYKGTEFAYVKKVLPAYAGMIHPVTGFLKTALRCSPRMRG